MDKSKQIKSKPTSPKSERLAAAEQVVVSKKGKTKSKPRKPVSDDKAIPEDLRGKRAAGRPSNAERTSPKYIEEQLALFAADLLADLRKNHKNIPIERKGDLLCKILPHLAKSDDEQDSKALSLELMGKKYLELEVKIHAAEEASREAASAKK